MGIFSSILGLFKGLCGGKKSSCCASGKMTSVERYIQNKASEATLTGVERYIRNNS